MLKENIKTLCKMHGITIQKLEEELNMSNGTIGKWDKSCPKTDTITKVADYFQVSIDYLLGRTIPTEKQKAVDEATALYDNLSPEDKGKVESYIKFLASQK